MKPVLKWVGGKASLVPEIRQHFPSNYKRYIEPFFGGGAVFFTAIPSHIPAVLNDLNSEIMDMYSTIVSAPTQLMESLDVLASQYSEEFYYKVRSEIPDTMVGRAARTIFLNKTGFNGLYRVNKKGLFNSPFGHRKECPKLYDAHNIDAIMRRMRFECDLKSLDFNDVLLESGDGDFVYCDPPYEPLVASSFTSYTKCGFGQDKQVELRDGCIDASRRGAFVIVSNSSADFVKEIYSDFKIVEIYAKRSINSDGEKRGKVPESLILIPPSKSLTKNFV